jgi:hypothetical protein
MKLGIDETDLRRPRGLERWNHVVAVETGLWGTLIFLHIRASRVFWLVVPRKNLVAHSFFFFVCQIRVFLGVITKE